MTLRHSATVLMLACTLAAPVAANGDNSARALYERAMSRERAIRSADQDQATLAEGGHLEDPAAFVKRLNELMLTLAGEGPSRIWTPNSSWARRAHRMWPERTLGDW